MIVSTEVEIKWSNRLKGYYMEKGYVFTKLGDSFIVKVKDLTHGSTTKVSVKCVNCSIVYRRPYSQIRITIDKSMLKEYYCNKCVSERINKEHQTQQEKGVLKRGSKGYWTFKENRTKEIELFIGKHGNIDCLSDKDNDIYNSLMTYDKRALYEIVEEMGYSWFDISTLAPVHYFREFHRVEESIGGFISVYGRFPSAIEMGKELKIQNVDISFHGGIENIRLKMNYVDENDLADDNGYRNKSALEFKVAQYLIANNVYHRRDRKPFKNRRFTCDFIIEKDNGEKYFLEVWGYSKNSPSKVAMEYQETRQEKEKLYSENGLNLISIDVDDVFRLNHQDFQLHLKKKLKVISESVFKEFKETSFLHPKRLTDEEILEAFMEHSSNKHSLPTQKVLNDAGLSLYTREVRKRYSSYVDFAKTFNKNTYHSRGNFVPIQL